MHIGKFYSWEVINVTTAIKICDKSFYLHRGSGVPHGMALFFGAEHMSPGKKTIHLVYSGKVYSANLICTDRPGTKQVQILWHADLGSELLKFSGFTKNNFSGVARFIRKSEVLFDLEMIKEADGLDITMMPDSILMHHDTVIQNLSMKESFYLQAYTDALNIQDNDDMLAQQQKMTIIVRLMKKWSALAIGLKDEMEASGLFASSQIANIQDASFDNNLSEMHEIKIGQYVQKQMRIIENAKIPFSEEEINSMLSLGWSRRILHIGHPFLKKCDLNKPSKEQISDATGNNRYWSKPFQFGNSYYFVCSQWYYNNRKPFDEWYNQIASSHDMDRHSQSVYVDQVEKCQHAESWSGEEHNDKKEVAVDNEEKIGLYVQKRLCELEAMGISFEPDYLDQMTTVEWTRKSFKIGFPFLKIMDSDIPIKNQIVDSSRKNRYWSKIFTFGNVRVFVCNEWHEYNRKMFDAWLKQVPRNTLTTAEGISDESDPSPDIIRLQITDYKLRHR